MKETVFYILISIRTANGFENIGKFYVGDDRSSATGLFAQLKGNPQVDEKTLLYLELMETIDELPVNLLMKTCTLRELGENCKMITREIFKLFNLSG
jgi:hypothetical protein